MRKVLAGVGWLTSGIPSGDRVTDEMLRFKWCCAKHSSRRTRTLYRSQYQGTHIQAIAAHVADPDESPSLARSCIVS